MGLCTELERAMFDQWLEEGCLGSLIDVVNIMDKDLCVEDIWREGSWDFDISTTVIPYHIKLRIMSTPFSQNAT
jgi:hypothetical protein